MRWPRLQTAVGVSLVSLFGLLAAPAAWAQADGTSAPVRGGLATHGPARAASAQLTASIVPSPSARLVSDSNTGVRNPAVGLEPTTPQPGGVDYFVLRLAPGETADENVEASNGGTAPLTEYVDPVDGLTAPSTGDAYSDRGQTLRGAGSWVSPALATLTLPPSGSETVGFTVRVPTDARPGDHLAGLAFQDAAASTSSSGHISVTTVSRSVIGILVEVPGPASARMAVTTAQLRALPGFGTASVALKLVNDGQLLVHPALSVTLVGDGYRGTVTRQLSTCLPGNAIVYQLAWPQRLVPGAYHVQAVLSAPGMGSRAYSGIADLGRPLSATRPGQRPVTVGPSVLPVPIWVVVLGVLVLLVAVALLVMVVRDRRRPRGRHGVPAHRRHAAAHSPQRRRHGQTRRPVTPGIR